MAKPRNSANRLVHITGVETIMHVLQQIPEDLRTDITAKVVGAGADVVVISAKRFAKRSERTGALREAIGKVTRKYKDGATAVAIVGVRRGYYKGRKKLGSKADRTGAESPSHYAHLVEYGHHAATGGKLRDVNRRELVGTGRYRRKDGKEIKQWVSREVVKPATGKAVSWVPAKPFLRPAFHTTKQQMWAAMHKQLERSIRSTRRRLIKKGAHAA